MTWTTIYPSFYIENGDSAQKAPQVAYGNGVWVVGGYGDSNENSMGRMSVSTDLVSWTSVTSLLAVNNKNSIPVGTNCYALTYGNGYFISGTDTGEMRKSTNGVNWTTITKIHNSRFSYAGFLNNRWFLGSYQDMIITSTDTITWTTANPYNFGQRVESMTYGKGFYTFVTPHLVKKSTDLVTWTTINTLSVQTGIFKSIEFFNDNFYFSNSNFGILKSTDTVTWTTVNSTPNIKKVAKLFDYLVGLGNTTIVSTDGTNWTTATNSTLTP